MTKQPLRTSPPAPMPAGTMFTSEAEARKRAAKPGKDQVLEIHEAAPGCFASRLVAKPKPAVKAKPKAKTRPRVAQARPAAQLAAGNPTGRKGGDA